jgi:hypothetical protein
VPPSDMKIAVLVAIGSSRNLTWNADADPQADCVHVLDPERLEFYLDVWPTAQNFRKTPNP